MADDDLETLVTKRRVLVVCGAGGVGKTTTSAALAVAAARAGRRVLVLTIDPARRLAQALGLHADAREPRSLPAERLAELQITTGSLDAWMLNPDVIFENIVRTVASTPAQAERIMKTRLFKTLSEMVAGMQEYTAGEALYSFTSSGRYDLVVLDTPPSRNALDFLEAPRRLTTMFDDNALSNFTAKRAGGFFKKAAAILTSVFAKTFGEEFFDELSEFLSSFSGMLTPLRQHAIGVRNLLSSKETAFLIVTGPDEGPVADAEHLRKRLLALGLSCDGAILNRSWASVASNPQSVEAPSHIAGHAAELADWEKSRVARDRGLLLELRARFPGVPVFAAPYLISSIDTVAGIGALASGLVAAESERLSA